MQGLLTDTPVQEIRMPVFESYGVAVFLKRDDLIHPFISGNKWRKLKYVLEDIRQQGKAHAVSFGGAYSNHLVALACAAAESGLAATAFIRGEEVDNQVLKLCRLWGMKLKFVSRGSYRDKEALYDSIKDAQTYFIDEGGKGELAARGCEEIIGERRDFSHVICAAGTGTTIAGLARSAVRVSIIPEGICVLKGANDMDQEIAALAGFPVKVHHDFHRGGYAKTDKALMDLIGSFASHTGILLDQVYTAKMVMAVVSLVESGYYKRGDRLLLIHTGGLLGLLSA